MEIPEIPEIPESVNAKLRTPVHREAPIITKNSPLPMTIAWKRGLLRLTRQTLVYRFSKPKCREL